MRRIDPFWSAPFLVTLVVVVLELLPLARQAGVPAFQQDWVWPVDRSQCAGVALYSLQPWQRQGVGGPALLSTSWWPILLVGAACTAGPHVSLILCLGLSLMCVGLGAAALARRLGCGAAGACVAAVMYVANPLILNKLEAGHWIYIAGCALLALAALSTLRRTAASWVTTGAIVGAGAAQMQFLPMGLALVWGFALVERRAVRPAQAALASIVAVAVAAPQWLLATLVGTRTLDVILPTRHWELSQSVDPAGAFRLLGYIGTYDARLIAPVVQTMLWLLPAGALAGLIARRRDPAAWVLAVLAAAGGIIGMGLSGPLATQIGWTFSHIRSAALFRELYDVLALTALGMSVLTGLVVHHARNIPARIAVYGGSAVLLAACAIIAARATTAIPMYAPSKATYTDVAVIAHLADDRRYLPYPDAYPLAIDGIRQGGYTPFSLPIGDHPSSGTSPVAEFPLAYGLSLMREHRRADAHRIFERAGIGIVFTIPGVRSHYREGLEPALKPLVSETAEPGASSGGVDVLRGGARLVVAPYEIKTGSLAMLAGRADDAAVNLSAIAGGSPATLITYMEQEGPPDPRKSWSRTALWPLLPAWVFAEPPGIFTLRGESKLDAPAAWLVAGATHGAPTSAACTRIKVLDAYFALLRCAANPTLRGVPPLVVSSATIGGTPVPRSLRSGASGRVQTVQSKTWRVRAHITAAAGSAIVLRDSYDGHWQLDVPGARHVEVDGYANAWVLPAPIDRMVTLHYDLAAPYFAALVVSMALVLAGLITAFVKARPQ